MFGHNIKVGISRNFLIWGLGKEKGVIGEVDVRLGSSLSKAASRLGLEHSVFIQDLQVKIL